jgi:DNA-binding FadR family transcriptional regulator
VSSRVSEIVHERLRAEIVTGRLAPGDPVPSERALSEDFGVNRHAVREALKRLQQAGLVQISQGGATRVRDWRATGGLELLFDLAAVPGEEPDPAIVRGILEMRASIGADAARRCAERAPTALRERIRDLAESGTATDEGYEALWMAIVEGSGNLAYRLALNTLLAGVRSFPSVQAHLRPGSPTDVAALGEAIAGGDGDGAERVARGLLEPAA